MYILVVNDSQRDEKGKIFGYMSEMNEAGPIEDEDEDETMS